MESIKFYYKDLPRSWANCSIDEFAITKNRLAKLTEKIKNLSGSPKVIYIQDGCSLLVKELFDEINFAGVNFKQYFHSIFDQQKDSFEVPDGDIIVIYNIGLESALNRDFSAQLLRGLIEEIKQEGKHIFLCSYYTPQEFSEKYNIPIVNKVSIQFKPEEKVI